MVGFVSWVPILQPTLLIRLGAPAHQGVAHLSPNEEPAGGATAGAAMPLAGDDADDAYLAILDT